MIEPGLRHYEERKLRSNPDTSKSNSFFQNLQKAYQAASLKVALERLGYNFNLRSKPSK